MTYLFLPILIKRHLRITVSSILCLYSVSLSGQCHLDRHSTNWFDSWISCHEAPNPNPEIPDGHWLLYDLQAVHTLYESAIWNHNDPTHLEYGVKSFRLDISLDAVEWNSLGTFELAQADGHPLYSGITGPNFAEATARYILLTVLDTWGGECAAIAEWSIQGSPLEDQTTSSDWFAKRQKGCLDISLYPNPIATFGQLIIDSQCSNELTIQVHDVFGRQVYHDQRPAISHDIVRWDTGSWPSGHYVVSIAQDGSMVHLPFIKS